jgi:hypothetical protein
VAGVKVTKDIHHGQPVPFDLRASANVDDPDGFGIVGEAKEEWATGCDTSRPLFRNHSMVQSSDGGRKEHNNREQHGASAKRWIGIRVGVGREENVLKGPTEEPVACHSELSGAVALGDV